MHTYIHTGTLHTYIHSGTCLSQDLESRLEQAEEEDDMDSKREEMLKMFVGH